jgi:hypothetical protein
LFETKDIRFVIGLLTFQPPFGRSGIKRRKVNTGGSPWHELASPYVARLGIDRHFSVTLRTSTGCALHYDFNDTELLS